MKIFFPILMILVFSSCKNDGKNRVEKKIFIVSKFNIDIEKHHQKTLAKNPELSKIKEIKLYDYPKGGINFIFLKDGSIFYHQEELLTFVCGNGLENLKPINRTLSEDSLHQIQLREIYNFLKEKSADKELKNNWARLHHLSFSFENDTIKNFDIHKLLKDIDSLGYQSYNVRRIAPFESEALKITKNKKTSKLFCSLCFTLQSF
ncbi:hypothetical protein K0U91_14715 [Chryseobacterium chendengshani]|uniref:hypothetical protein n=1 Tax=Chryseobacterium sp. LJ668 TaxID=2864040 RepID=UPI001C6920F9|nr:hypothetical protein [Chryseobacterium sp. LJ668]MBW8522759.1 hypothetical protein [Chryseobacterium sp. LJ668]QYK16292.1 hypothetical protein K0U91_14715 [Chryseobacterium sp. LJ668]